MYTYNLCLFFFEKFTCHRIFLNVLFRWQYLIISMCIYSLRVVLHFKCYKVPLLFLHNQSAMRKAMANVHGCTSWFSFHEQLVESTYGSQPPSTYLSVRVSPHKDEFSHRRCLLLIPTKVYQGLVAMPRWVNQGSLSPHRMWIVLCGSHSNRSEVES
jgi:hypothetical protein